MDIIGSGRSYCCRQNGVMYPISVLKRDHYRYVGVRKGGVRRFSVTPSSSFNEDLFSPWFFCLLQPQLEHPVLETRRYPFLGNICREEYGARSAPERTLVQIIFLFLLLSLFPVIDRDDKDLRIDEFYVDIFLIDSREIRDNRDFVTMIPDINGNLLPPGQGRPSDLFRFPEADAKSPDHVIEMPLQVDHQCIVITDCCWQVTSYHMSSPPPQHTPFTGVIDTAVPGQFIDDPFLDIFI